MKIQYVENKNGKLFSFSRYDFKADTDDEGNYIMIDGGFDYNHYSGVLHSDTLENLIKDIREQFIWIQRLDKDNNRIQPKQWILKDMATDHIEGIIEYLASSKHEINVDIYAILKEELKYRKHERDNR